jgi:hypothetical protein
MCKYRFEVWAALFLPRRKSHHVFLSLLHATTIYRHYSSLGPFGRNYEAGIGISNKGASGTFSVAFSKGAFLGFAVEGAALGPRSGVNDSFYGTTTTPPSVLTGGVTMPADKPTMIQGVYAKLTKLAEGQTYTPTADEAAAKASLAASAQQASEVANQAADVVKVDAAAEAQAGK